MKRFACVVAALVVALVLADTASATHFVQRQVVVQQIVTPFVPVVQVQTVEVVQVQRVVAVPVVQVQKVVVVKQQRQNFFQRLRSVYGR